MCGRCLREGTEHYDFSAKPKRKRKAPVVFSAYVPTDEDIAAELATNEEAVAAASQSLNAASDANAEVGDSVPDNKDISAQEVEPIDHPDSGNVMSHPAKEVTCDTVDEGPNDAATALPVCNMGAVSSAPAATTEVTGKEGLVAAVVLLDDASMQAKDSVVENRDASDQDVEHVNWLPLERIATNTEIGAIVDAAPVVAVTGTENAAPGHQQTAAHDTGIRDLGTISGPSACGESTTATVPTGEEPRKLGRLQWAVVCSVQAVLRAVGLPA